MSYQFTQETAVTLVVENPTQQVSNDILKFVGLPTELLTQAFVSFTANSNDTTLVGFNSSQISKQQAMIKRALELNRLDLNLAAGDTIRIAFKFVGFERSELQVERHSLTGVLREQKKIFELDNGFNVTRSLNVSNVVFVGGANAVGFPLDIVAHSKYRHLNLSNRTLTADVNPTMRPRTADLLLQLLNEYIVIDKNLVLPIFSANDAQPSLFTLRRGATPDDLQITGWDIPDDINSYPLVITLTDRAVDGIIHQVFGASTISLKTRGYR